MSKKNNRFARKYRSLTEIGQIFNLSARVVGKELKRLGYREPDGRPTEEAFSLDLAVSTPLKDGTPHFRWNRAAVIKLLEPYHPRDRDMKIRKIVREMKLIIESKEFEDGGGGFDFVVAEATLFELADELPVTKDWESIVRVITEEKTSEENRAYMIELALDRLALSRDISAQHVQTIFSHEDPDSLELLSENEAVDEVSRARAKALASTLRQR